METMQEELKAADDDVENQTEVDMRSALVYLTPHERDGVEGIEIIVVPGDPTQDPIHKFVEAPFAELAYNAKWFKRNVTQAQATSLPKALRNSAYLYEKTIENIYQNLENQ